MRVIYSDVTDLDPTPGIELLRGHGITAEILDPALSEEDFGRELETADAVVCGYRGLTRELLRRAQQLRLIATLSVGVDMVDVDAATESGVQVCNVPPIATEEVAVHALSMLLMQERGLERAITGVRSGGWDPEGYPAPRRLSELTLGLVGFGRIGQRLARLASPLFGSVLAFDPYAARLGSSPDGTVAADFDEILGRADVLSLHAPQAPGAPPILSEPEFGRMRPGSGLVNVARGGLIDHAALLAAVDSGRLRYACLDATDPEPLAADSPLRCRENVVITPHVAFASERTLTEYALAPAREIVALATGAPPLSPVNRV